MTYTILWMILAGILSAAPVICIDYYNKNHFIWWLMFAFLCNIVLILVYIPLFRSDSSIMYTIAKLSSIFIAISYAVFVFGQVLRPLHYLGLCLTIGAITCLGFA